VEAIKRYWEKATPMSFSPEKWDYETKRKFRYELQDYMQSVFQFDKWAGKSILEIGCGSGIDAVEFARNGAVVVAIDITDNAVQLTKDLAEEANQHIAVFKTSVDKMDTVKIKVGGNEEVEGFDCVYSYGVLHHIPDVDSVLKDAHRLLKPGGVIMAMLYNKDSILWAYSILKRTRKEHPSMTDLQATAFYSERNEGCPYTKAYTKQEAIDLFGKYFKDVSVSVHYNVVDLPQQRKVKLGISDEYELGWHLVVKAVK